MEGLRKRVKPEFSFNRDMKHGLKYYEDLQKVLDGRATKKSNTLLRRSMIAHRNKQNYQLEYDRIRDMVHSKTISGDTFRDASKPYKEIRRIRCKGYK